MLKSFVVRTSPLTNQAMLVDATSRKDGKLRAIIGNEEVSIGFDTYAASGSVDLPTAQKIVQTYAQQNNIPLTEVLVRSRLPKTNAKVRQPRKLDDANLVLVGADKQATQKPQEDQPAQGQTAQQEQTLEQRVQAFHDSETKKKEQKAAAKGENKTAAVKEASATNPEGATVKRSVEEKKTRRKYVKQNDERTKRSAAALKRYQDDLAKSVAQSPTIMEPAVPGPNVTAAQVDDAVMELAVSLARILKGNLGVL